MIINISIKATSSPPSLYMILCKYDELYLLTVWTAVKSELVWWKIHDIYQVSFPPSNLYNFRNYLLKGSVPISNHPILLSHFATLECDLVFSILHSRISFQLTISHVNFICSLSANNHGIKTIVWLNSQLKGAQFLSQFKCSQLTA